MLRMYTQSPGCGKNDICVPVHTHRFPVFTSLFRVLVAPADPGALFLSSLPYTSQRQSPQALLSPQTQDPPPVFIPSWPHSPSFSQHLPCRVEDLQDTQTFLLFILTASPRTGCEAKEASTSLQCLPRTSF